VTRMLLTGSGHQVGDFTISYDVLQLISNRAHQPVAPFRHGTETARKMANNDYGYIEKPYFPLEFTVLSELLFTCC
jgi:hypothetical protein